jgi:hypothetical protein
MPNVPRQENQLFHNFPATSYPRASIPAYPNDPTTSSNDSVARVNGNEQKVGPAIILKVMFGDSVDIAVKYFYTCQTGTSFQCKNLPEIRLHDRFLMCYRFFIYFWLSIIYLMGEDT